MLTRVIGEDVELSLSFSPTLGNVRADYAQREQAIMNLAVNSRDAMPDGGVLSIETEEAEIGAEAAREPVDAAPGEYVRLTIRDTGIGMNGEVLSHVFEPFFATREKGRGTGLGLSSVYGIVKQSGAISRARAHPERALHSGSTCRERRMGRMPRIPRPREPRSRAVRVLVESALKNLGYRVRAATGGAEALRLIQYPQFPADLVITDVVMPKVGGKELSQKIRTVRPGVKILFISGYPGRAVLDVV